MLPISPAPGIPAAIELPADHDARADARAERHAHHVAERARLAEAADAQRKTVAVVVDMHRHAETLFEQVLEVNLAPRRDAHHIIYDSPRGVHHRRHADTDPRNLRLHKLPDKRCDMIHHLPFGTVGFAGFGKQPHDMSVFHKAGAHVRAAQIHAYSHLLSVNCCS